VPSHRPELAQHVRVVRVAVVHQPLARGREQPEAAVARARIRVGLWNPRVSIGLRARGGDLDAPGRRREPSIREADHGIGKRIDRAARGQLVEADAELAARQNHVEDRAVAFVQLGLSEVHRAREPSKDLGVRQRFAGWILDLHLCGDVEVEIGDHEVVELEKARGRQHDVREVGGVGLEQVDYDGKEIFS